jgi:hypothetical protein
MRGAIAELRMDEAMAKTSSMLEHDTYRISCDMRLEAKGVGYDHLEGLDWVLCGVQVKLSTRHRHFAPSARRGFSPTTLRRHDSCRGIGQCHALATSCQCSVATWWLAL